MISGLLEKFKKNNSEVGKSESSHGREYVTRLGENFDRKRSKSRPKKDINGMEGYYYHEMGHYQYQCKKLRAELGVFKKL